MMSKELYETTTDPGSFERIRALEERIKQAEVVGESPDHPHAEGYKDRLEKDRQKLEEDQRLLKERLSRLSLEERSKLVEEHDRLDRTIVAYEKAIDEFQGPPEGREKMSRELNEARQQRTELERQLPQ